VTQIILRTKKVMLTMVIMVTLIQFLWFLFSEYL